MGQAAGAGAPPQSGGVNRSVPYRPSYAPRPMFNPAPQMSGGFGRFNMAAIAPTQRSFGGFSRGPMRPAPGPVGFGLATNRGQFNPAIFNRNANFGSGAPSPQSNSNMDAMMRDAADMGQLSNSMRAKLHSNAMAQAPRFAEGGSTSNVVDFGAMASDSPVYNRTTPERFSTVDNFVSQEIPGLVSSATFKKSPVFQPLVNPVTGELNQRTGHIPYRPLYQDYSAPGQPAGLGATPQYAQFQMQMPTFDRPGVARDTSLERPVPYNPPSQEQQLLNKAFNSPFFANLRGTPEQQAARLNKSISDRSLTEAQYNKLLQNPAASLEYVKAVQAGQNPTRIGYQTPPPNSMMTAAQRQAYDKKVLKELDELIRPITVFEVQDYGGA